MFAMFPYAPLFLIPALSALRLAGFSSLAASSSPSPSPSSFNRTASSDLFYELEELSRLTAIAYCVGSTGIQKPFQCLSHCSDFENFELVTVSGSHIFTTSFIRAYSYRHRHGAPAFSNPTHAVTSPFRILPLPSASSSPSVEPNPSPTHSTTS